MKIYRLPADQSGNRILPFGAAADLQPADALESIVSLAARWYSAPLGLAHFTDSRLGWLRPSYGVAQAWAEREITIGVHSFVSDDVLLVPDARADQRYADNPLVTGPAGVRFYAGVPLPALDGTKLGTLCILDRRPRRLTAKELGPLRDLAVLAGDLLTGWLSALAKTGDPFVLDTGEQRYRELFENATDIVYTHDLAGRLTAVNRAAERILGYTRAELLAMTITELVSPEHEDVARQMILEQFGGGTSSSYELALHASDGRVIELELSTHLLFERGRPTGLMGFGRDVTGHKQERTARRRAEERLSDTARELDGLSAHLQQLHRLGTTNYRRVEDLFSDYVRTGCKLLGVPVGIVAEVRGESCIIHAFHSAAETPPSDLEIPLGETRFLRAATQGKTCQYVLKRPRGRGPVYEKQAAAFLLCVPIFAGESLYGVLSFASRQPRPRLDSWQKEIVELMAKALGRRLLERDVAAGVASDAADRAQHDELTGLFNARSLTERLEQAVQRARRRKLPLAVVSIDVDRFRQFNSLSGHSSNDLLRQIAERLKSCLRDRDSLGRMDADRFAAVVDGVEQAEQAKRLARRMLEAIREPFHLNGMELFVTASLGISMYPGDGTDAATLLRNAYAAIVQVKRSGRDNLMLFSPEDSSAELESLELENALRRALQRREFRLRFQPQITMDGTLGGLEALLSWHHPKLGKVPADQFIPVAEDNGMIVPIGTWVLNEACRQCAAWQKLAPPGVMMAVNVSAVQLSRPDFLDVVAGALDDNHLAPRLIELEVTESAVMRDIDQSVRTLTRLRKLGVSISIDDFGTGYSSLSYLQRLPVDTLKIDRSFLEGSYSPRPPLPLIEAIVRLAHAMGLTVVGEGVESKEQLELLRRAGCDKVQGHLFGRPLAPTGVERLLRNRERIAPVRQRRQTA